MSDQRSEDETLSADMLLIDELVEGLRLSRWAGDSEIILKVGNLEDTRILAVRHGLYTFETTSRGRPYSEAAFSSARDARRYLIMDLCGSFRFRTSMVPVVMKQLAPGTELEEGPTGHRLTWPGSEASFYHQYKAVTFSWVIDADPAAIVASYQHPNGEPLFDLEVPSIITEPRRSMGRAMDPAPIEVPPPDEAEVDQVTIDTVLADLGWKRRAASGAEILAVVGHGEVGRAISYRQSQFVYESVVEFDYRSTVCTFFTAAAARRFMIMELSAILRMQRQLPKIQLNRLAPGCASEKGPIGFELSWPGGEATFPIGYIGHQQALDFSWVATAELADIAASYRHPNGEPLFDLSAG
ncbi:MAG TPA: hypothetical protein VI074_09190 [Propionibacteriaceae bacterium]|jgi:hypothetical protein